MIAHAILLIVMYLIAFSLWIMGPSWKTMLLYCVIAGQFAVNDFHDGAHFGFTNSKRVNWWASVVLDLIGGSSLIWAREHNAEHHTYTQTYERES